jgi:hypothetical protein
MRTMKNRPRRVTRAVLGACGYCAGLAVVGAAGLGLVLLGRPAQAARLSAGWQRRLGDPVSPPVRAGAVAGSALVGLLLGLLSVLPLGVLLLFVLRGVFYGLVDPGPYNHSWGGPGRGGAWLAHFLISLPLAAAALAALYTLARLHRRCVARLAGEPGGAWTLPLVLVLCLAGGALFVAWLHQI